MSALQWKNHQDVINAAFHGKPPRFIRRLIWGDPRAWGRPARRMREEALAELARHGITLRYNRERPGWTGRVVFDDRLPIEET